MNPHSWKIIGKQLHNFTVRFQKYQRLHEAPEPGGLYGTSTLTSPHGSSSGSPPGLPSHLAVKEEASLEKRPNNTRYLSNNCVLLTYFSGDVAAHVDDHFSRALSQPSAFSAENQGTKPPGHSWKGTHIAGIDAQFKYGKLVWIRLLPFHHYIVIMWYPCRLQCPCQQKH